MEHYTRESAAARAGVEPDYLGRLVELGILAPDGPERFSGGDVRRALMARSLEDAGISLDAVADAMQRGALSLEFLDAPSYERFAALSEETFQQVAERTGIPLELLPDGWAGVEAEQLFGDLHRSLEPAAERFVTAVMS